MGTHSSRDTLELLGGLELSDRQQRILRSLVLAYVRSAAPIGSEMISQVLPLKLSSASVRTTLAELSELGLIEKPHASAGRVPTERGLRLFVDSLLDPSDLGPHERRSLERSFGAAEPDGVVRLASNLLSEHSRLLGFVLAPRLDRVVLRHVSLVRLSTQRLLMVLISRAGHAHRRVIEDPGAGDQHDLDRIAATLNERLAGRTLSEVRYALSRELGDLRSHARSVITRQLELGLRALDADAKDPANLVIDSRMALLDQPELSDPQLLREIFSAVEAKEHLLEMLDQVLDGDGVSVSLGEQLQQPGLRHCALVAAPYGGEEQSLGVLGVIGPSRMNYSYVIALVGYCSQLVGERLESGEVPGA